MIKQNINYEYKISYTCDNIKCWKKKSRGKWYKIKPETYYEETGVKFIWTDNWNSQNNSLKNEYIIFNEE